MQAAIEVKPERLITTEGTIIPQCIGFNNGNINLFYQIGTDGWFTPCAGQFSNDYGKTWKKSATPIFRPSAMGQIGDGAGIILGQYMFKTGDNKYAVYYSVTSDSGETFSEPKIAKFYAENLIEYHYEAAAEDDPAAFCTPEIPEFYNEVASDNAVDIGGHLFGRVIRLPDGALGVSAYMMVKGNMTRKHYDTGYIGKKPDEANAPEAADEYLWSSLFFRSEDNGKTWKNTGTIGTASPGKPFDVGILYSEGYTETGLSLTKDGRIYACMRHGSYMLLYFSYSDDGGYTWTEPEAFNFPGVAPSVELMSNGALAMAWGRPGLTVGFSLDGNGKNWDILAGIESDRMMSQKYGWIIEVSDNTLLLFYDRRKWDNEKKKHYDHGIYCREIFIV